MPKSSPSGRSDLYVVRLQGKESTGAPAATLDTFPMSEETARLYWSDRWSRPHAPYMELGRGEVVKYEV